MAISIDQLPYDTNGGLDGLWLIQLRQNLNGGHAGVEFRDGRSVTPLDSRTFRQFVAAMGPDIVGAIRVMGEPYEMGDTTAIKPANYDDTRSKSLEAQGSEKFTPTGSANTVVAEKGDNPVVLHTLAGARFETKDMAERRKAFEEARGNKVEEGPAGVVAEQPGAEGGTVRTGGEPVIDPAKMTEGEAEPIPQGTVIDGGALPTEGTFVDTTAQQQAPETTPETVTGEGGGEEGRSKRRRT